MFHLLHDFHIHFNLRFDFFLFEILLITINSITISIFTQLVLIFTSRNQIFFHTVLFSPFC